MACKTIAEKRTFLERLIVGFLGSVVGVVVMLGESVLKIVAWFKPPPV